LTAAQPEDDFLPSPYQPGIPNPDDALSAEEHDLADRMADEERAVEKLEAGFYEALAEGRKSRARIATAKHRASAADAVLKGDLAAVAGIMGLKSPLALRQAAPKPANDNSPYPGIVSSADFLAGFTPPDYHLDGIAQAGFLYALTAGTGTGKTAVSIALTASTALGTAICGREVRKGRVVYFAGENPDDVRMRWMAMAHHAGFDPTSVDVHFIAGTFSIPAAIERIRLDVEKLGGADLIVVDTSAAYFTGDDENGNTALGKHAKDLRLLTTLPGKPCVIVPCHPVKNADQQNLQPRGGGAFIAEVDGNLVLTRDRGLAKLHWQVKHRGPDFSPLYFELQTVTVPGMVDSKGRLVPTVMAVGVGEATERIATSFKTSLSRTESDVLSALSEACGDTGRASAESWRRNYQERFADEKPDTVYRRWKKAKDSLIASETVKNDGHWLFPADSEDSEIRRKSEKSDELTTRTDSEPPYRGSVPSEADPSEFQTKSHTSGRTRS